MQPATTMAGDSQRQLDMLRATGRHLFYVASIGAQNTVGSSKCVNGVKTVISLLALSLMLWVFAILLHDVFAEKLTLSAVSCMKLMDIGWSFVAICCHLSTLLRQKWPPCNRSMVAVCELMVKCEFWT